MACIAYVEPKKMQEATIELLAKITAVVEDYAAQGYKLSLRQLYYQLVSKDIIPNQQKAYQKLSALLTDARMCGMVDWDAIEDRGRQPQIPSQWDSLEDILEAAASSYRLDRHVGQENYIEVWVEKDALSGVLLPITSKYHVHLMVNKGYSSISAMHEAAKRFQHQVKQFNRAPHILYLGDHDPSGLDMIRDIWARLVKFGLYVDVHPIALTMEQIEEYNPPPNPAKVTDPRATGYIEQHGDVSWELDALPPKVLHELLQEHLEELIDMDKYQGRLEIENADVQHIREFIEQYNERRWKQ